MNSPNPGLVLSSPLFLRKRGFRESSAYELSEEYLRVTGMAQQEQQEAELAEQENKVI
jgi:hypothetical protein